MVITSSSEAYNTRKTNLTDSILEQTLNYNSLDGNFVLGTHKLIPEILDTEIGWRSKEICDNNSIFQSAPIVNLKFDTAINLRGFFIVGDKLKNEYPVNFKISAKNSNSVIWSKIVSNNIHVEYVFNFLESLVDEFEIEIYKWNKPNKCAKLLEFYLPQYYTLEENIVNSNVLEIKPKLIINTNFVINHSNLLGINALVNRNLFLDKIQGTTSILIDALRAKTAQFDMISNIFLSSANAIIVSNTYEATNLTPDRYRKKFNPVDSSKISNYIIVNALALSMSEEVELYSEEITINGSKEIIINFDSNYVPVSEGTASILLSNGSIPLYSVIVSSYIYPKSAFIILSSTQEETITLKIKGKYLISSVSIPKSAKDDNSISENGKITYSLEDNFLIQTEETAQKIADLILASYKDPSRDISVDWRGNPAIELSDTITCEEFGIMNNFLVTKQELIYDGALKSLITGRKKI